MNIPKEIIEKAIEGGWILRDGFKAYRVELLSTAHPSIGYWISEGDNKAKYCEKIDWEEIALDPTFWQALGKSLGWSKIDYPRKQPTKILNEYKPVWQYHAHRFYDLILQGKPTDEFWRELGIL